METAWIVAKVVATLIYPKDVLTHFSQTGDRRVKDMLPADILDIVRALPVENGVL